MRAIPAVTQEEAQDARLRQQALTALEQHQQRPLSPVEQFLAEAPQELPSSFMAW